jgi:Bacterial extracellular solute-binding proteins, family 5 Middle
MARGFIALIVSLGAFAWACSSRTTTPGGPVPPQTDQPPDPPRPAAVAPEPPKPPDAAAKIRPDPGTDECAVTAAPGEPIATVALGDRIDPTNAPRPTNESERLLFRQLYETLVRIDCLGRIGPGLAVSWQLDANGRTWNLTLRENAHFSDGTPVTAADVHASWTRGGSNGELRPDVSRLVESVVAVGDRALAITLRRQRVDAPLALAHADLAVARSVAGAPWPLGTRSSRIATDADSSRLRARSVMNVTREDLPPIRLLAAPGDPRDLLDEGVDLLLTRDPAALDYAATLPAFQSVPLAWQRIHVLLTPGRSRSAPPLSEEARQLLADDAVRGEARGARGPFWWETTTGCEVALPQPRHISPAPRIVYDASDLAGRDLAERFVGLARASGPTAGMFLDGILPDRPRRTYQRAAGLSGDALASARRLGNDAGYVVSLDSRPVDPCRELQALMDTARWLDPGTIVALVETRMQAIVRRGRAGLIAEWDGGLMIAGANDPIKK